MRRSIDIIRRNDRIRAGTLREITKVKVAPQLIGIPKESGKEALNTVRLLREGVITLILDPREKVRI